MSAQVTSFEFIESHNVEFTNVAFWMRIMGIVAIVLGIIAALSILSANIVGLIGGIVSLLIGIWTVSAASSFRQIATSQGSDIDHLMNAIVNLKKLYRLQAIMVLIYAVIVISFFVYALFLIQAQG